MEEETQDDSGSSPQVATVPWFRQLSCVLRKNLLLLSNRPIQLLIMFMSSVGSVLLAFLSIQSSEKDIDFATVPLTECGTVDPYYLQDIRRNGTWDELYNVPLTHNEPWRDGLSVTLLAMGPMFHAIMAFIIIQVDIQTQMLGILRGLGLRDSVFWASWWIPFIGTSVANSLGGAITAAALSSHAFENIYFMGVFGSFFFLNLALVGASLFLAAVCGTARGGAATWNIILILIAQWTPYIVQIMATYWLDSPTDLDYQNETPLGLFWVNRDTTSTSFDWQTGEESDRCERPIISQAQGSWFKTEEERQSFPEDEFFVGCYFSAGYISSIWNKEKSPGLPFLFMFPYVHFNNIWGNFLGFTAMPNRSFSSKHVAMSTEELAIEALPNPLDPDKGLGSSLFPQGSTLNTEQKYYYDYYSPRSNCPAENLTDYFCPMGQFSQFSQCASAFEVSPTTSPSVIALFGYLFILSVIYTILAAYWTQVFPGKNGSPRKFYFFLLPSYWFGTKVSSSSETANRVEVSEARKSYGGFQALKGVSMTMASNEVTALLGHNGAGKTTLSHILSCEIGATGGEISVFGHSVVEDPDAVRGLVAVCKQDDYLYPDLSAKQHLELCGGLRGVPQSELPEVVQKWLESVDLSIVQNQYSSAFSGGMKRRLSLACSTIGGRPLIILDEPTTGMDPLSRRFVWRHIDEIKQGRVVLLTTHAMEEADLLADSVAIMRKGELAAYGTPLELKSEYGSPLQFTCLVPSHLVEQTKRDIKRHFEEYAKFVEVVSGEAGNITVKITAIQDSKGGEGVDVDVLTDFVVWLEDESTSGVTEYGFSNSSLEEVFLKVTQASDEEVKQRDELDEYDVCCAGCSRSVILCCMRSCCRCCCCPRRRAQPDNGNDELDRLAASQAGGIDSTSISSFTPVLSVWSQTIAIIYFTVSRHWIGKWSSYIFYVTLIGAALFLMVRATNSFASIAFLAAPTAFLSMSIITFISPIYRDRELGVLYLMRAQGLLKPSFLAGNAVYAFTIQFILTFIMLSLIYLSGLYQPPDLCPTDDLSYCDPPTWSWTRTVSAEQVWFDDETGAQVYANWQGGGYWKMLLTALAFALTTPGAVFSSSYLPGFKLAVVSVVTISILAAVTPLICFYILAPKRYEECVPEICDVSLSDYSLADLKSSGTTFLDCIGLQISEASGSLCLPKGAAILPQFGLFQMLALTLVGDIRFTSNPPEYIEVFMAAFGDDVRCGDETCQFPAAHDHFLSNFGYMVLGAFVLLALGFCFVSFFSFPSGFVLQIRHFIAQTWMILSCERRRQENESKAEKEDTEPFDEVVEESALVDAIVKGRLSPGVHPKEEDEENGNSEGMPGDDDRIAQGTPSGADTEASRDNLPLVLAHKLRKVYPSLGGVPPKVALKSLDLHVPKGQVLGLLGQNGAGKTTAIKIWAGSHEATSGLALVAGFDVSSETLSVFERLGNCPQFDIVCPSETVQRHLEFFALLKGLPMSQVKPIAQSIASAVGLGAPEVYHRHAGRLSGGMRRRLSIAISLVGAPSVLLLDEPTTGLDPSTRNSIWNLINSFATKERAIIITTHMMLEADTLCNRIAIMAHGKLKVVGTQQALKDRFGSGYLLQLNLIHSNSENQEKALAFVRSKIHQDAVLQNRQAKTLRVALPRDVNLSDVFRVLYSKEITSEGCINQFLLSQSSLEDVFIALGD